MSIEMFRVYVRIYFEYNREERKKREKIGIHSCSTVLDAYEIESKFLMAKIKKGKKNQKIK